MGGQGSGNRGANAGMRYFTVKRRRELAVWKQREAERQAARREQARLRSKEKAKLRQRRYRAERKAAGLPPRKGGKDKPGASTIRMHRLYARRKAERAAFEAAIAEAKRLHRASAREAAGKRRIQPRAEIQAAYRARKQAELLTYWFSPDLDEKSAKQTIKASHPSLKEDQIHEQYISLAAQCRHTALHLNVFTIAREGEDGVSKAREQRAICYELTCRGGVQIIRDWTEVLTEAAAVAKLEDLIRLRLKSLADNPWLVMTATRDSLDFAQTFIGPGDRIYGATLKAQRG